MDLIEQEKDVVSAIHGLELQQKPATLKGMLESGRWAGADEATLAAILDRLVENGLAARAEEVFTLTMAGLALAKQSSAEKFGEMLIACQRSPTYRKYCTIVYGTDRCHFDMMTQVQFEQLKALLLREKPTRILDLGCGTGEITEAIAQITGAETVGIDFSASAIAAARAKTSGKSFNISFEVMDMDDLQFPAGTFDAILSIDTLYFTHDLNLLIRALQRCLKEGGRMAIFYSTYFHPEDLDGSPTPECTPLGLALQSCQISYQAWDFSNDERPFWEHELRAAEDLKAEFEAEGNLPIYQSRVEEAQGILEMLRTGKGSRYLYLTGPAA